MWLASTSREQLKRGMQHAALRLHGKTINLTFPREEEEEEVRKPGRGI